MNLEETLARGHLIKITPSGVTFGEPTAYGERTFTSWEGLPLYNSFISEFLQPYPLGFILNSPCGTSEIYGTLRWFRKQAERTKTHPLPTPTLRSELSSEYTEKLYETLAAILLSFSRHQRSQKFTKEAQNGKVISITYPNREANFAHTALDLTLSDPSLQRFFDDNVKETRDYRKKQRAYGDTFTYQIVLNKLADIERWRAETQGGFFEFASEEDKKDKTNSESLERFLLDYTYPKKDGSVVSPLLTLLRTCINYAKKQQRVLIRDPTAYHNFLLPFANYPRVLEKAHTTMMQLYQQAKPAAQRMKELTAFKEATLEDLNKRIKQAGITEEELKPTIQITTPFKLPIMGLRYKQEDYEQIYTSLRDQKKIKLPPQLPQGLRKLGFYVWRKSHQLPNSTTYALVKIKGNSILSTVDNPFETPLTHTTYTFSPLGELLERYHPQQRVAEEPEGFESDFFF